MWTNIVICDSYLHKKKKKKQILVLTQTHSACVFGKIIFIFTYRQLPS